MFKFNRRLLVHCDRIIFIPVLLIAAMGLLNLYSATYSFPARGTSLYIKQIYFFIAGIGLIIAMLAFDYRKLIAWNRVLYAAMILILLFVLVFGKTIAGTQRWISLGFFNLQPSEPAKLIMVVTLANLFNARDCDRGLTIYDLILPGILTLLPFLLILKQPDLGTALMLFFIFFSIAVMVKLRWSTIAVLFSIIGTAIPLAWKFILKPYQIQRITTFLNPEGDPSNTGYHILQSKIAVGSGMKFGKGFLHGTQGQLNFLPERHTDFAFSVWAEEWGFVGSIFFLACYFFLILWGLKIAASARDKFGALLAFGIVALIFWQAFINLAMIIGLLPVVGMPLPLFSYGGSSLLTTMTGIGILVNINMRRFKKN